MHFRRCAIVQALMRPVMVIELEVITQTCAQFWDRGIVLQVDVLVLDGSP